MIRWHSRWNGLYPFISPRLLTAPNPFNPASLAGFLFAAMLSPTLPECAIPPLYLCLFALMLWTSGIESVRQNSSTLVAGLLQMKMDVSSISSDLN